MESGCGRDPVSSPNYGHYRFRFPEIRDVVNDTNSSRISGEKNNPKSGANEPILFNRDQDTFSSVKFRCA